MERRRYGYPIGNYGAGAFLDAAIFLILAFFMFRLSPAASVAALALYVTERIVMAVEERHIDAIATILFTLVFVNGVRGTFAHRAYEMSGQKSPLTVAALATKILSWILPTTKDPDGARRAALHGVVLGAIGVVLLSGSLASEPSSNEFLGAIVILAVLVPTSIFILWRMCRLAALAQLTIPTLMAIMNFSELPHDPQDIAMLAFLFFLSANAVRGTFAWHRMTRTPSAIPPAEQPITPS